MGYPYQIGSMSEYREAWTRSIRDPEGFWGDVAGHFTWRRKWDRVLTWNFKEPSVKWFEGARLNKLYREGLDEEEIVQALTPIIEHYANERTAGEHFGDFVIRAGYVQAVRAGREFHD